MAEGSSNPHEPAAKGSAPAADTTPKQGSPNEGLEAFANALVVAAKATPADTSDPQVAAAFALGWQMAELYRPQQRRKLPKLDDDLPGLGSLGDHEHTLMLAKQVQAAATKLKEPIEKSGLPVIDMSGLATVIDNEPKLKEDVRKIHGELLEVLTASDFRLGKAYGLGRALADTCRKPTDQATLQEELGRHRVANLLGWLEDLSSQLPAHSAHSVAKSLERWVEWAAAVPESEPIDHALHALRRQGDLWRALLSGEKHGTEMLEIDDYLDAGRELATQMRSVARALVGRFPLLTLLAGLLLTGGIALLIIGSSSAIVAGAGSILAALGLTWKGLGSSLGQLAGKLEQPLWGAVLDTAITDAITLLPQAPQTPATRRERATRLLHPQAKTATTHAQRRALALDMGGMPTPGETSAATTGGAGDPDRPAGAVGS
jgi:hypothetical protein